MTQILKYQNVDLNHILLKGHNLSKNLVSILLNFRVSKNAKSADIGKMFHQVKVRESDRDTLRLA